MTSDTPEYKFDPKNCLRDHFLIAMPGLADSHFGHTVIYMCDHNDEGAMGLIINQGADVHLTEVFSQLSIDFNRDLNFQNILSGGPVNNEQGLVIHRDKGNWDSTLKVTPEVFMTASKDIVKALAQGEASQGAQLVLGHAGWSAGQLEEELANNSWLTMPADHSILFDTPSDERWQATANAIGFNLDLIANTTGHA